MSRTQAERKPALPKFACLVPAPPDQRDAQVTGVLTEDPLKIVLIREY